MKRLRLTRKDARRILRANRVLTEFVWDHAEFCEERDVLYRLNRAVEASVMPLTRLAAQCE